jgi:hypothetical protein
MGEQQGKVCHGIYDKVHARAGFIAARKNAGSDAAMLTPFHANILYHNIVSTLSIQLR